MVDAGCLTLVLPDREVLLRPRPDALADARDLDSSRLDVGLAALPDARAPLPARRRPTSAAAVATGAAQAGVLLRPATVAQIEATAHGGERMPPKTTFFHPKPKTGLVFRAWAELSGSPQAERRGYRTSQVAPLRRSDRQVAGALGRDSTASASWRFTSAPYSRRSTARNTPIGRRLVGAPARAGTA